VSHRMPEGTSKMLDMTTMATGNEGEVMCLLFILAFSGLCIVHSSIIFAPKMDRPARLVLGRRSPRRGYGSVAWWPFPQKPTWRYSDGWLHGWLFPGCSTL